MGNNSDRKTGRNSARNVGRNTGRNRGRISKIGSSKYPAIKRMLKFFFNFHVQSFPKNSKFQVKCLSL